MGKKIEEILESIEIDDHETWLFDQRQRVLTATPADAMQIIQELNSWEQSHPAGRDRFGNQPYYFLFEAYAWKILLKQKEAVDRASRAISLFRMRDSQWNEAMGHWFLSSLYEIYSRKEDSCRELQTAASILETIAGGFQRVGDVTSCLGCQHMLRQLYRQISLSKSGVDLIPSAIDDHKVYLLPTWMPIYEQIQLGEENLPAWAEPSKNIAAEIQLIIIEEHWYSIKSVRPSDEKIVLDRTREYGWAKVRGHDMNAVQPIRIEDGDYVLFIKQGHESEDDIVVASLWDIKKKEYSYIVRKLGKKVHSDNTLYSESSGFGDRYKPIPVGDGTQILGRVIAVAKPIKSKS